LEIKSDELVDTIRFEYGLTNILQREHDLFGLKYSS